MSIRVECPSCNAKIDAPERYLGKTVKCGKCSEQFVVQDDSAATFVPPPIPPPFTPPPDPPSTILASGTRDRQVKRSTNYRLVASATVAGVAVGVVLGYFAGHHFPFYGGLATMGEPYSPARDMLARGHMVLFGSLFGVIGFAFGLAPLRSVSPPMPPLIKTLISTIRNLLQTDPSKASLQPSGWGAFSFFIGALTVAFAAVHVLTQLNIILDRRVDPREVVMGFASVWTLCLPFNAAGFIAALIGYAQPNRKQGLTAIGLLINGFSLGVSAVALVWAIFI